MEKKLRLAVLFGGVSSEHEISLLSATSILENLDREKYEIYPVGITKTGSWLLFEGSTDQLKDGSWEQHSRPAFLSPDPGVHGLVILDGDRARTVRLDCLFPALHGRNGEDGTIQGLFQLSGIPFVGCDTLSSAVCMDKAVTHTLLSAANIEQAHYLWFYADRYLDPAGCDTIRQKITARFPFPVFVKPANAGSSVGVSRVDSEEELDAAIRKAMAEDKKIVVEEGIVGQEVECAVMGNRECDASIVGEIQTGAEFYDYDDKYINGVSTLHIPARIPDETAQEIRRTAARAYRWLGCSGLARVDFFVRSGDNKVILNEINTLPGFTSISMYPKLRIAGGVSYSQLLDQLIDLAFAQAQYRAKSLV